MGKNRLTTRAIDRVIDVFPAGQQNQIRNTLSEALKGVVAQNPLKRIDVKGRVAALEILVVTPAIANLIREAKTFRFPACCRSARSTACRRSTTQSWIC